jgi:hypothetical protein
MGAMRRAGCCIVQFEVTGTGDFVAANWNS